MGRLLEGWGRQHDDRDGWNSGDRRNRGHDARAAVRDRGGAMVPPAARELATPPALERAGAPGLRESRRLRSWPSPRPGAPDLPVPALRPSAPRFRQPLLVRAAGLASLGRRGAQEPRDVGLEPALLGAADVDHVPRLV